MQKQQQKPSRKTVMAFRTMNGIWANSLSTREPQGANYFEYVQNLCKFKNSWVSSPVVVPVDLEFPVGVPPQAILSIIQSPISSSNSKTLLVGEENLLALSKDINGVYSIVNIPIGGTIPHPDAKYLGTLESKPIFFQDDILNTTIILTYLGYIIRVNSALTTAEWYSPQYTKPTTGTIYRAMSGSKTQNGYVLGTISTSPDPTIDFDLKTSLLFEISFQTNPLLAIGTLPIDGMTTGISPCQQHFQISSLSERWFFEQQDIPTTPPTDYSAFMAYTQTKMSNDIFPYISYSLPSVDIMSGLFDGNNITYTNSSLRDPLPSAMPDYNDLNDTFYDPTNTLPKPIIVRNLIGGLCQNLESVFINRVNVSVAGARPINRMMSLSYDFTSYSYHKMNRFDASGIGDEIELLCFGQATLGNLYPLACYGTDYYTENGIDKIGLYIESRFPQALPITGMPKRHILKSMRLNPFDADGNKCMLTKIQLEMKMEQPEGQGLYINVYVYDDITQEPTMTPITEFDVSTVPTGANTKPSKFAIYTSLISAGYDVQVEIIVDCVYMELTGIDYFFTEVIHG